MHAGLTGLPNDLHLRPVTDADEPVLEQVYASTRSEELALTDWSEAQKAAFVAFQFRAQNAHYRTHYHDAVRLMIEHAGQPVGRLYLHWRPQALRIVDITLLPSARGRGFGTLLLERLIALAGTRGCSVSIHVEKNNRARDLYLRLGFRPIGEHGVYDLMERPLDAR